MQKKLVNSFFILFLLVGLSIEVKAEEESFIQDNDSSYAFIKNYNLSEEDRDFSFTVFDKVNLLELSTPSCKDAKLALDSCLPSVCYEQMPFGKIYRQIIGIKDKRCIYRERSKNQGGIDCKFDSIDFKPKLLIIEKHYDSLSNREIKFTSDEISRLQETYRKQCSVVVDNETKGLVTLNKNYKQNSEFEEFLAQSREMLAPAGVYAPLKTDEENIAETPDSKHSSSSEEELFKTVMFKEEDVDKITRALQENLNSNSVKKTGSFLASNIDSSLIFYLNSVLYIDKRSWVVWLNNYKLATSDANLAVNIIAVYPDKVDFKWDTKNLDKVANNWRNQLKKLSNNAYESTLGDIRVELKDDNSSSIYFTLKPNQSFIVPTLSVVEGKK